MSLVAWLCAVAGPAIVAPPSDAVATGAGISVWPLGLTPDHQVVGGGPVRFSVRHLVTGVGVGVDGLRMLDRVVAAAAAGGEIVRVSFGPVATEVWTALGARPRPALLVDVATEARPSVAGTAAMARGTYESLIAGRRAVTARDLQLIAAAGLGDIERAATIRPLARPDEIVVAVMPLIPAAERTAGRLSRATVLAHHDEAVRQRVESRLRAAGPSDVRISVDWAGLVDVAVTATVVVEPGADREALRTAVVDHLNRTITPLGTPTAPGGRPFGEPLRVSDVHRMLEDAAPQIRYAESVGFVVDPVPAGDVRAVAAAPHRPGSWYVGTGDQVFRSGARGRGWEAVGRFPGETVRVIVPAPAATRLGMIDRPGYVVAVTRSDSGGSVVRLSTDGGETWTTLAQLAPTVVDAAWLDRTPAGVVLLATDAGLYELAVSPGATPQLVVVDPATPDRACSAVETFTSDVGCWAVAVASRAGVSLSTDGTTFAVSGAANLDVRALAVQYDSPAVVLWAGIGEADPSKPGKGCQRARMFEPTPRWESMASGWTGGSCWSIAFAGRTALAATQSGGVLVLDTAAPTPQWRVPDVNGGLPLRDRTRFEAVSALAAMADGSAVLAGGLRGIVRSTDLTRWSAAAASQTRDPITLPPTALLCSGEHTITVVDGSATPGS
ncbi:hypothetical protein [Pseudonocardia sp. TRM90224]|uniref:hypothetical protein n=1 Tax=Pseudonocardia sp. TRM90224 TaxID=2812678 RepID=UPI001E5820C0|nr:hypothetical protein [Pseudonocardia sp. TRM90224]